MKVPGGGRESRRLSFRTLDIEQIGHVYEGLLEHTARRATEVVLGLEGKQELEVALSALNPVAAVPIMALTPTAVPAAIARRSEGLWLRLL